LNERSQRKTRVGKVVSDKMDKTVIIAVETLVRHPLYGRTVRRTKKYKAHDEMNACQIGDKVLMAETRPLSKEKRWRVAQILIRAEEKGRSGKEEGTVDTSTDNS
jgi:small subunit ribosomal protein S17